MNKWWVLRVGEVWRDIFISLRGTTRRFTSATSRVLSLEIPKYSRVALYLQAVIWVGIYYAWRLVELAPGDAIGVLAVVALIMAVRGEYASKAEQFVWIFIALSLFSIETRVVHLDRDKHDAQQRQEIRSQQQEFESSLSQFRNVSRQIDDNITKTTAGFTETMNTETGGDSFLYLDAQPYMTGRVYFTAVRVGRFPLRDVAIRVHDDTKFSKLLLDSPPSDWNQLSKNELKKQFVQRMDDASNASEFRRVVRGFGGKSADLGIYELSDEQQNIFEVSFTGFTRDWYEQVCLRRVGSGVGRDWSEAIRVRDSFADSQAKTIFIKVDPDFPKGQDGKPDTPWRDIMAQHPR